MSEIYPSSGFHNRTRGYELETDCAFRRVELPMEVELALGQFAENAGSTPLDVLERFAGDWSLRHRAEIDAITEDIDTGQPYDEWRRPKSEDDQETGSQQAEPTTIHRYLIVNHDKLSAILKSAKARQITPAEVTAQVIVEGLQEADSSSS